MQTWVHYGCQTLSFEVPDRAETCILQPKPAAPAPDPDVLIAHALSNPIGADLHDLITPYSDICILCDDISRPTPVARILSVLLPYLQRLGADPKRIHFVLALGSHRTMTQEEVIRKLGAAVCSTYPVYQSSLSRQEDFLDLGTTPDGVPISVYRKAMESDIRIGIGNIVPHNTLGWSGGCKILFPGVTSEETVCKFHLKAMMRNEQRIFGNPENTIRQDVERWTQQIGLHFLINTILTGNGELYQIVAGDYIQAHRQGVAYAKDIYAVETPFRPDIVVTDSYPSDCDFWQGTKGFNPADVLLPDGGSAVLVSPFQEGVGPHLEYPAMIGRDDATEVLERICKGDLHGFEGADPLAIAVGALLSRMRQRFSMYIHSDGISDDLLNAAKIARARDLSQLLEQLNSQYSGHARIAILQGGAEIVPVFREDLP